MHASKEEKKEGGEWGGLSSWSTRDSFLVRLIDDKEGETRARNAGRRIVLGPD